MTRALALGCLLGAGLVGAYAWATRKRKPAPAKAWEHHELCPCPTCKPEDVALNAAMNAAVADLFARSWGKPRISLWCDLCGCELLPDGRCPDRDKVHPT